MADSDNLLDELDALIANAAEVLSKLKAASGHDDDQPACEINADIVATAHFVSKMQIPDIVGEVLEGITCDVCQVRTEIAMRVAGSATICWLCSGHMRDMLDQAVRLRPGMSDADVDGLVQEAIAEQ